MGFDCINFFIIANLVYLKNFIQKFLNFHIFSLLVFRVGFCIKSMVF